MPSYSGVFTLQAQMQAIGAQNWPGYVPAIGEAYQGGNVIDLKSRTNQTALFNSN